VASALGSHACRVVTLSLHTSSERPIVIVGSATTSQGLMLISGMLYTIRASSLSQVYVRASGASGLVTWLATTGDPA
jgi:hypothetical protein